MKKMKVICPTELQNSATTNIGMRTAHKDMVTQAYLGRQVSIEDENQVVSGIVDAVNKAEDGLITVQVMGKDYDPEKITRVSLAGVSDQ